MKNNIGHNQKESETSKLIKQTIDGIENYENQKTAINESIAEIKANAKANGLCVKTIGKILKLRKTGIDIFNY